LKIKVKVRIATATSTATNRNANCYTQRWRARANGKSEIAARRIKIKRADQGHTHTPRGPDPVHRYVTDKDGQILKLDPVQHPLQTGTEGVTRKKSTDLTSAASSTYDGVKAQAQALQVFWLDVD
jgi:hypothetical protein